MVFAKLGSRYIRIKRRCELSGYELTPAELTVVGCLEVSLLQREQKGMAEFDQTQPEFERVLRQNSARGRRREEGQLLVPGSRLREHVRGN